MKILHAGRGEGKTVASIQASARYGYYIVCLNHQEADRVFAEAFKLNYKIPFPITFNEFLSGSYAGRNIKGLIIDNVDLLLKHVAKSPIHMITLS